MRRHRTRNAEKQQQTRSNIVNDHQAPLLTQPTRSVLASSLERAHPGLDLGL